MLITVNNCIQLFTVIFNYLQFCKIVTVKVKTFRTVSNTYLHLATVVYSHLQLEIFLLICSIC